MTISHDVDVRTHAVQAVDTALALLSATEALNRDNTAYPLSIHIGINSGMALVGSTRFEGVRGTRWTFTASGSVTNLAARLAAAARSIHVLAGPETVPRLADGYRLAPLVPASLQNPVKPAEIHRILN